MKKNVFVYGSLAGLISVSWMLTAFFTNKFMDMDNGMIIGYATMIVAFSFIFVGVKNYRDKLNGGLISFGLAFKMGLLMTLVASTLYVIVWAIDYNFFVPDFMDKYCAGMIEKLKSSGLSPAELDKQIASVNGYKAMYKNPLLFTLMTYSEIFPTGLLLSLVSAFILKRKVVAENK